MPSSGLSTEQEQREYCVNKIDGRRIENRKELMSKGGNDGKKGRGRKRKK